MYPLCSGFPLNPLGPGRELRVDATLDCCAESGLHRCGHTYHDSKCPFQVGLRGNQHGNQLVGGGGARTWGHRRSLLEEEGLSRTGRKDSANVNCEGDRGLNEKATVPEC